jgi:hypothetical protein
LTAIPVAAPLVTAATVSGKVGTAFSFAITATDARVLTYSLTGAPTGMSVNAGTGLVTWSAPIVGTYSIIAHALDAHTGLTGQATLHVSILAASPPQVAGGSVAGTAQAALTFVPQVTDANVVTLSLSGAPSGMSVSTAGVVSWASPLAGTYKVTVNARDSKTGLNGQGLYTVTIGAAQAPTVPTASLNFTAGKALAYCVNATGAHPLTYSLAGAPSGMTIGSTGCVTWSTPTVGTHVVTVTVKDTITGLTGKGIDTVAITAAGPAIAATTLAGVAGKALTGRISFTDGSPTTLTAQISGAPSGMTFTGSAGGLTGSALTATWAHPVTGTYALKVTITDSQKLSATAIIPVTITAH